MNYVNCTREKIDCYCTVHLLTESEIGESVAPVVYPEEASDTTDHRLPLSPCMSDLKDKFNHESES